MREYLQGAGYRVYCVPEVPTILMLGGCEFPGLQGGDKLLCYENKLLDLQLEMEEAFVQIAASTGRKAVVIMDRGALDIKAYVEAGLWSKILEHVGASEAQLLGRYDAIIHLVTSAHGAQEFYKMGAVADDSGQSVYREETPEQARLLCDKTQAAWRAHTRRVVVENGPGGFEEKLKNVVAATATWIV